MKKHMPSDPHLHLEDVSWKYTGKCTFAVCFYSNRNNNIPIRVIILQ